MANRSTSTASSSSIVFHETHKGARYVSGGTVFDEMLSADGRLVARYWNPNGQVWPEMHFGNLKWRVEQKTDTFQLSINSRALISGWTWHESRVEADTSGLRPGRAGTPSNGVITLRHEDAKIDVKVHTRVDGGPFLVRWLEITNLNPRAVGINAVAPFSGMLWAHRFEEHLAAGEVSPFHVAYTHQFDWGREGDFFFEPLMNGVKTVNGGKKGRSGFGRPAFWARNKCNGQTFVCELAWGGNYEFSLDCDLRGFSYGWNQVQTSQKWGELIFRMGLSGYEEVLRVLDAGETLRTPAVHLALFQDNDDAIVQATHEHVRHVVMPAQIAGRHVEIEANHRGYLCDRENVPGIIKDIDVVASLGVEMYVIDAGWYGNEPNRWADNVGDWFEGKWLTDGGGLKAIAAHARKHKMKFGLWVEIEAAGAQSILKKEHPDWLYARDGNPIAGGRAIDLSKPVVAEFVESTLAGLIEKYELDMYRIDHNHTLEPAGNRQYQGMTEDLTWRYYDAFNGIFKRLTRRFPNVVFQNCASGGGRLDWGTMALFHNVELSDFLRMPRDVKILNGVSYSLPPEILLRTFGTETGDGVLDGDVNAALRTCMSRFIFRGTSPSLEELSPYLRQRVEHYVSIYKELIRPTIIDGRMYHHTGMLTLAEATPWCVLEYAAKDYSTACVAVFRTSAAKVGVSPDEYCVKPRGLHPAKVYSVTTDNSGLSYQLTGEALSRQGINVRLENPLTSELLLFRAVGQ